METPFRQMANSMFLFEKPQNSISRENKIGGAQWLYIIENRLSRLVIVADKQ